MPDREKVINGLRDIDMFIAGRLGHEKAKNFLRTIDETIALLKDDETRIQYLNDHIAMCKEEVERLYKEQEAVEPKVEKAILDYQSWHYICGDCGGQIDIHDNYCRHCGRVVAHISNKI